MELKEDRAGWGWSRESRTRGPQICEVRGPRLRAWCSRVKVVHSCGCLLLVSATRAAVGSIVLPVLPLAPCTLGSLGRRCSLQSLGVMLRMQEAKGGFAFLFYVVCLSHCP